MRHILEKFFPSNPGVSPNAGSEVTSLPREDGFVEVTLSDESFAGFKLGQAIAMLQTEDKLKAMLPLGLSEFLEGDLSILINGQTIFMHAAGSPEVLEYLLSIDPKKAPHYLNIQDVNGYTAMHSAACAGRLQSLIIMLENGAKSLPSHDGKTPALLTILDSKYPHRDYSPLLHFLAIHTDFDEQEGQDIMTCLNTKEPRIRSYLMLPFVIDWCIKNENKMREIFEQISKSSRNVVGNHAITL